MTFVPKWQIARNKTLARYIMHHEGMFFEWSTIVDALTTEGMTYDEMRTLLLQSDSQHSVDKRLARTIENGVSCLFKVSSIDSFLVSNRAGENETHIPVATLLASLREEMDARLARSVEE